MKYDITTMGSATIDMFVDTDIAESGHMICYPVGAKLTVKNMQFHIGGGGTNTAVSFARLGLNTAYLGKIGEHFKKDILNILKKEKISFVGKVTDDMNDYSIILDTKEHNRTILTYKGANNKLMFKDIDTVNLKTKWFYFCSMMGDAFATQIELSNFAKKNNIKIAFNPSYYQISKFRNELYLILKNTTILILNKEEAIGLTQNINKKKDSKKLKSFYGKNSGKNMIDLIKKIHDAGPEIVCITDGKNTTFTSDGNTLYEFEPHKEIVALERTGAGDAFASSLVAAIAKDKPLEFALHLATINSESVIQNYGAKNILLSWDKALKQMKKYPLKIRKSKI
ncbi:MAG: carbohydrate kinase family protein [Candidatus Aenigmarchaeota archaeon]|nr:carbohydrate kinase family protein [Candidatus Aenigmarchaeota archaeon]